MADFKHPHTFEGTVYFAPEGAGWERYETSPQKVLNQYGTLSPPEYPLRLVVYRPMEIPDGWAEGQADLMVEQWRENWCEEFDMEGDADDGLRNEDEEALGVICRRMAKRSQPFYCEPTGDILIMEAP